MEFKNLTFEKDGKIAIVTINRPKALNALNTETFVEIGDVVDEISKDNEILAVIVTGAGRAFVAGADITEMQSFNSESGRNFGILANSVLRKLENLEKPVIAAVNGFALGGGSELSLACDIRIASTKAKFGQPESGLGITPGAGGTQRLVRTVGPGMAKELIYTAKIINADEAYRIGLVNKVVEPDDLMKEAKDLANSIAANAPIAVKMCKAAINKGIQCDIDTGLSYESAVFGLCFATEDQKEGMTAFVEKRDKCFKNR